MTAEEYTIERLIRLDKEVDILRGLNKRAEENCDFLRDKAYTLNRKLEHVKQIIISTLDHEGYPTSEIMLYKEDAMELIKVLDIKIDMEVIDEVPED